MNSPSAPLASAASARKPYHDTSQDFHQFLAAYREAFPEDVLHIREPVCADQDPTARSTGCARR